MDSRSSSVMDSPRLSGRLLRLKEAAKLRRLSPDLTAHRVAHTRHSRVGDERRLTCAKEVLSLLRRARFRTKPSFASIAEKSFQ